MMMTSKSASKALAAGIGTLALLTWGLVSPGEPSIHDESIVVIPGHLSSMNGERSSERVTAWETLGTPFAPGTSTSSEYTAREGFPASWSSIFLNPKDLNVDGKIDRKDLLVFLLGWYTTVGQPGFRRRADLNRDLLIDREDLIPYIEFFRTREKP